MASAIVAVSSRPEPWLETNLKYQTAPQNFSAVGVEAQKLKSHSFIDVTLTCFGASHVTLVVPLQVCTKVGEFKAALCAKLGYISTDRIAFIVKQGCSYRTLLDTDQVRSRMTVKGVKDFRPQRHRYEHPYGIIGTGYNSIKMALLLEKDGQHDYIMFDRYDRVGGHAWLECANKTTRLQTEFGCYHVWMSPELSYGADWADSGTGERSTLCGGPPTDWEIWPTRDRLLEHFQLAAESSGMLANAKFSTEVERTDVVGRVTDANRYYQLTYRACQRERKDVQGGGSLGHQLKEGKTEELEAGVKSGASQQVSVCTICQFPGNLIHPRIVTYKGEEDFGGIIEYGVEMRFDYNSVTGKIGVVHGHGAFTMENIRSCLEHGAMKVYVLCRKRNLTCPRLVSWFVNQANPPVSGPQMMDMLAVGYKMVDYDPWNMHSVHTDAGRRYCTIKQTTRFGIGDIYFLGGAYGLMEIVIGEVKRCTHRTLHLDTGRKLECDCVLKCLGLLPDWSVDRLHKLKELKGYWVNGDPRRSIVADPNGIRASNFAATTTGPGSVNWCTEIKHFWDHPNDWAHLIETGAVDMLPSHTAGDPIPEIPAYMMDAAHGQSTGILIQASSILLQEKCKNFSHYKHYIQTHCASLERVIADAKAEWDAYEQMFRDRGMVPQDAPYVPYPYPIELMNEAFERHAEEMKSSKFGDGAWAPKSGS